jgi:cell division initiation protein
MRISPIDIQQQRFKTRPFGYEKDGVDTFLELLAEELERLIRRNQDLQEELARANASLAEMREREETLKATLLTTQKVTDELKSTARREVDVMMAEAEIKSERLMRNAEERRLQLIEEIQEIKRQKVDFEVSLRGLLEKHIRMLGLNAVAVERDDAEARLLEEPLPFSGQVGAEQRSTERVKDPAEAAKGASEAADQPINPDPAPVKSAVQGGIASLDFDIEFELNEENGEEDLLR